MTHPRLLSFGSDLVTLAHYKYPKWVEFLSCELNYAVSSLHQFTTSLNVDLPAEEEEVRSSSRESPSSCPAHAVSSQTASISDRARTT